MIRHADPSRLFAAFVAATLLLPGVLFAQERTTKKQVSANGTYTIYMREDPDKSCRVIVTKDGKPHWQLQQCVGTTGDLFFVSNDGESFWVLHTLARIKKQRKKPKWGGSVVAEQFDREGKRRAFRTAGALVPKVGIPEVRELGGHVKWMGGVLGVPGKPPWLTDANILELETVGPGYVKLRFENAK